MTKKQTIEISFRCKKCGKLQPSNKKESTAYFEVLNCLARCECGGEFVMYLGNEKAE